MPREQSSPTKEPVSSHAAGSAWSELVERFPDQPALQDESIYALPLRLIDAIIAEVPGFFTENEAEFEHALARAAGDGFFLRRNFACPLLNPTADPSDMQVTDEQKLLLEEFERRHAESKTQIHGMIIDEMRGDGCSDAEIDQYFDSFRGDRAKLEPLRAGYAGWLATDRGFRAEVDEIREHWGARVGADGEFPEFPQVLMFESPPPVPPEDREFHSDFMLFYRRWGIEKLVTWDVALPMRWEMASPSFYHLGSLHEAGALVFVPWYALRDRSVTLYQLVKQKQAFPGLNHLTMWLDRKPRKWGVERYATMLQLYVYLELALKCRYRANVQDNMARLDCAFARFIHAAPDAIAAYRRSDTIRKIRQKLDQRLANK